MGYKRQTHSNAHNAHTIEYYKRLLNLLQKREKELPRLAYRKKRYPK